MIRKLLAATFVIIALLTQAVSLQQCATPTPPRGGDRDSLGPVIIAEESTPNFQTNFRPELIQLEFDEWVELDPAQEIIISPPLDLAEVNQPRLQRSSLIIPLTGLALRDSVTYVVNIGAAIKDLNEGNPTENLRFVFATGPVLDTAEVTAQLVDAFTGEPLDGAALTLYDKLSDTAALTENPTYFAVANDSGSVTVSNVKPGRYRVVSLARAPGATGYFADYDGFYVPLAVGYLDSIITVTDGTTDIGTLRLSGVPVPARIVEFNVKQFGVIKIAVNQAARLVDIDTGRDYLRSDLNDTIRLFYREQMEDTVLLGLDGRYSDTLFVSGTDAGTGPTVPLAVVGRPGGRVNPADGYSLVFNRPLERLDTSLVRLYRDTLDVPVAFTYVIDTLDPTRLVIASGWQEQLPYRLEILPGGVTDWSETSNRDSVVHVLNVSPRADFGDLTLSFENLNATISYLLRLVDPGSGNPIVGSERIIRERFEYTVTYNGLKPATYRLELIYDSNDNGRYDGGDLRFGRQPEIVRRFEIEPLRANWEVEKVIDLENN